MTDDRDEIRQGKVPVPARQDARRHQTNPLNGPDVSGRAKETELAGARDHDQQAAYLSQEDVDRIGRPTDTDLYENEQMGGHDDHRAGETGNPDVAAEEGLTWVPPTDPPVVRDRAEPEGAHVAAGFGTTSATEPYDMNHEEELVSAADEVESRVRDALRADAATSRFADSLAIGGRFGVVAVRGVVDDMEDTDNITSVIGRVSGITRIVDQLEVRGVTD